MRAYYLETPLTDDELREVAELMETEVEQVRIPYVLPAPDERGAHPERPMLDDELAMKPLKAAGALKDYGQQVLLVMPLDGHWYVAFRKRPNDSPARLLTWCRPRGTANPSATPG